MFPSALRLAKMSYTPAMRHFMHAKEFAVVGKVLTDPERWDHKVLKWYQARELTVTPIKPGSEGEMIEGVKALGDPTVLPNLSQTSISVIIHPSKGLPLLQSLYPPGSAVDENKGPWGVWFQPGADDEAIRAYVQEKGLEGRVVVGGKCVLVTGDGLRAEEGLAGSGGKSAL